MKKKMRIILMAVSVLTGFVFLGLEYKLGIHMDFRNWDAELYRYRNCLIVGKGVSLANLFMLIWFKERKNVIGVVSAVMLVLVVVSFVFMP